MVTSNCTVFDPEILARGANGNVWEGGGWQFFKSQGGHWTRGEEMPPLPNETLNMGMREGLGMMV